MPSDIPPIELFLLCRRVLWYAAFERPEFPGAVGQDDPQAVFLEAKRNIEALMRFLYGDGVALLVMDTLDEGRSFGNGRV